MVELLQNRTNRAPAVTIAGARRIDTARIEVQVVGAGGTLRAERRPAVAVRTAKFEARAFHVASGGEENSFAGIVLVNEKETGDTCVGRLISLIRRKPVNTSCAYSC